MLDAYTGAEIDPEADPRLFTRRKQVMKEVCELRS